MSNQELVIGEDIIKYNDKEEVCSETNTKTVYILLTMTGTLLAKIIRLYTGEPYSHVSLAFDEDLEELYSYARKSVHNPFNAGFMKEDLETGVFGFYKEITNCSIYSLTVTDEQYASIKNEVNRLKFSSNKCSYNYVGILGVMLNMPIEKENKYICSQFVAVMLEKGGVKLFNKSCALVRPFDFRTCKKLTKIYEGKLIEYKKNSLQIHKKIVNLNS